MADYNPFDQRLRTDPYTVYRELREEAPVYWSAMMHVWVVTRFDDVLAILRDHGRFSSERTRSTNPFVKQMEEFRSNSGPIGRTLTMLSVDPPAHTRMRNLVNKAFTPRVVDKMRPRIREIAQQIFDELPQPGQMDVVHDLAVPLPVIVIAETLGVPASDRDQFKAWSTDVASSLGAPFQPPEALTKAQQSSNELADYFRQQIALRRKQPRDDLLSSLIAAEEQGDLLSNDELIATCILLLVAGNETTTNLIGNGMLALLQNPEQRREVQQDSSLLTPMVEEMLRFDGPVQMTSRVATEDLELRGHKVETGQVILAMVAAANHDPEQFPAKPDAFDLHRGPGRNFAFGHGIHYCIGAPLAMAEAEETFRALLERLQEPTAAFEAPDWGPSFILRGLRSLQVTSKIE